MTEDELIESEAKNIRDAMIAMIHDAGFTEEKEFHFVCQCCDQLTNKIDCFFDGNIPRDKWVPFYKVLRNVFNLTVDSSLPWLEKDVEAK